LEAKRQEGYLRMLWRLIPDEGHDYFNYGLIDLGALVCHYRYPRCNKCPLREFCIYYLRNTDKDIVKCLEDVYRGLSYGI